MNGAQLLARTLENEGVDIVFGYSGGASISLYDAILGKSLRHVLMMREQAAVYAADAYARSTGKVGVCLATSGPGATNLVTGLANAALDSVPLVAITGQVSQSLMGADAFQEIDIFGLTLPIVKHSFVVRRLKDLPGIVREAFSIAVSDRPGPVLVDIPRDIIQSEVSDDERVFSSVPSSSSLSLPSISELEKAVELIRTSQKPLIYAGVGVRISRRVTEFRALAERTGIPVVTSLQGIGALPTKHPLNLGILGIHGLRAANIAVQECDLLIAVGARFQDRATEKLAEFAPNAKVIHMDIDHAEFAKLRTPSASLVGDLKRSLGIAVELPKFSPWTLRCLANRRRQAWKCDAPGTGIYAPEFLRALYERADENTSVACDVGPNQMWVAQHYEFLRPEHLISSGGLGTMGFGLPAAIGAQMANHEAKVLCVSSNRSLMMNMQELATLRRYKLPVKIVLFSDHSLGLEQQWQGLFHGHRSSEVEDNPDFVRVAEAFGISAFSLEKREESSQAIQRLLHTPGPVLCQVEVEPRACVWPPMPREESIIGSMEGGHC